MAAILAVLLAASGITGGLPQAVAATGTITWDSRADFEGNAATTGEPTTRAGVSTSRTPGSVMLPGAIVGVAAGDYHTVALKSDGSVVATGDNNYGECAVSGWSDIIAVAAGSYNTIGVRRNGTVLAIGDTSSGKSAVSGWVGIKAVAAAEDHTVGLKGDGTVVAVGENVFWGQCNVSGWTGVAAVSAGKGHSVGLKTDGSVVAVGWNGFGQCSVSGWTGVTAVSAGYFHTVGLKGDGTVVAVGNNANGQCNVSGWTDIVAVAAGNYYTVGVKRNGTVVAVGNNASGQCNVSGWAGIAGIAASSQTLGLKSDGTVVAVGDNTSGQCSVSGWTVFTAVAAGYYHTVGLKGDGTVVAVGRNNEGQCNVSGWSDITAIVADYSRTVGLTTDGSVVATGSNDYGQCNVSSWASITGVAAGYGHTVGLKSDGTVVAVGDNGGDRCNVSGWTGVTAVSAGSVHTVGLRSDGTVVATGLNGYGQCDVSSWVGITAIAAGYGHTVGLKSDGTVVAVGDNTSGQCNVSGWTGITAVAVGGGHTVGLKSDGTVVAVGSNAYGECSVSSWAGITGVAAGYWHSVGQKSDGTVVAAGNPNAGQCAVSGWTSLVLGDRTGTIGGAGAAVGLRASATSGVHSWTRLDARTSLLRPFEAVKFAVRLSDDGATWSEPVGLDGQPIDWASGTGNYLGRAVTDASARSDLTALPLSRYIDIVVRVESKGALAPELKSVALEYLVNEPPVAVDDTATTDEDEHVTLNVLANDSDPNGDVLSAALASAPSHGTVELAASGEATYTPNPDYNGTDTFTYRAYDGEMYSDPATVTITVTPVNDAPSFTSGGDVTVNEDSGAYSAAWASAILAGPMNESSQALHFDAVAADAALFSAQPTIAANGTLTFTPAANANGTTEVSVTLTDDGTAGGATLTTAPQVFDITVTPVNDAPVASDDATTTAEDIQLSVAATGGVLANDIDVETPRESLTATLVVGPIQGTLTLSADGGYTYTPDADFNGVDSFTYRAADGLLSSHPATVTITVTPLNDAPSFTSGGDVTVDEDSGAYSAAWASAILAGPTNESEQTLHCDAVAADTSLFSAQPAIAANGTLTFTPAADAFGTTQVTVTLTDDDTAGGAALTTAPQVFDITVNDVSDLPTGAIRVAGADRYATAVETSKRAFTDGADTVVIATGANWPDALGGSALAGAAGGPLLLTARDALPADVSAEIERLGATKAYILGGTAAVGAGVESALKTALGASNVERLAGGNRYETARTVADEVVALAGAAFDGNAYVATGGNFPDALAASPIAAAKLRPILLADPRTGAVSLPPSVRRVFILGGTSAVGTIAENGLVALLGRANVSRLEGVDRYATAATIANHGVSAGLSWNGVGIVTGANFPDGLSGGAMLGRIGAVMLLTPGTSLAPSAKSALEGNAGAIETMFIIGGKSAVSDAVMSAAAKAAGL